jgi:hypothetical protein
LPTTPSSSVSPAVTTSSSTLSPYADVFTPCPIPAKAVPLPVPLTNAHNMTTRAKTGLTQPRLESRLLLAKT